MNIMGGDKGGALISFLTFLVLVPFLFTSHSTKSASARTILQYNLALPPPPPPDRVSAKSSSFVPKDLYLIDCGSDKTNKLIDDRVFKSETETSDYVNANGDSETIENDSLTFADDSNTITWPHPLLTSAKVFRSESRYVMHSKHRGRHWIRLYFYPISDKDNKHNLKDAKFHVTFDDMVLLRDFSIKEPKPVYKEYLVTTSKDKITIVFTPVDNSIAFVNAIEVVSAPDSILPNVISSATLSGKEKHENETSPNGDENLSGKDHYNLYDLAFEMAYRLNVGGKMVRPINDTMFRTWIPDKPYMTFPPDPKSVTSPLDDISFPENSNVTTETAPSLVYASADMLPETMTMSQVINLTWILNVDTAARYDYLVRLHFSNIKMGSDPIYQNVFLNQAMVAKDLYVPKVDKNKAAPMFRDFLVQATDIKNSSIRIEIEPSARMPTPNVTLNGIEVLKISNYLGSLNGYYDAKGKYRGPVELTTKIIIGVGGLVLGWLILIIFRWRNRPEDCKDKGLLSWLISGSRPGLKKGHGVGSRKGGRNQAGLCKMFTLQKLQSATNNFHESAVVGVGGFGKVYIGTLEDGTKIAIKRANQGSDQGINEFKTEIELLSKLRHRHLVSLVGYCDQQKEMILVYEYMENGPLRDHLYNSNLPPLSWKQRLEICIGSCRGLHYLHTGATDGIIHRDVKTTNILLDENFVAKVSDFGLSKVFAPSVDQTHVSTAVKGSFGYLDPEYFRTQQLTEKSDVYSFGVLLFEVLCARPVINVSLPMAQVSLAEWAMTNYRKGQLEKIVDPHIAGTIFPESMKKFAEAAEKCLAECGIDRPAMGDVLWNLEYALQLQDASTQASRSSEENSSINHFNVG